MPKSLWKVKNLKRIQSLSNLLNIYLSHIFIQKTCHCFIRDADDWRRWDVLKLVSRLTFPPRHGKWIKFIGRFIQLALRSIPWEGLFAILRRSCIVLGLCKYRVANWNPVTRSQGWLGCSQPSLIINHPETIARHTAVAQDDSHRPGALDTIYWNS